jgi:hypothetical protein
MTEESITIQVADQTAKDLEDLIREIGYERQEGLRTILGAGMMAIRHEKENPDAQTKNKSWARWLEVEKDLAVLRFRLFREMEANRRWELSTGAVETQNVAYEKIENLNKEVDILRERLKEKE